MPKQATDRVCRLAGVSQAGRTESAKGVEAEHRAGVFLMAFAGRIKGAHAESGHKAAPRFIRLAIVGARLIVGKDIRAGFDRSALPPP